MLQFEEGILKKLEQALARKGINLDYIIVTASVNNIGRNNREVDFKETHTSFVFHKDELDFYSFQTGMDNIYKRLVEKME